MIFNFQKKGTTLIEVSRVSIKNDEKVDPFFFKKRLQDTFEKWLIRTIDVSFGNLLNSKIVPTTMWI